MKVNSANAEELGKLQGEDLVLTACAERGSVYISDIAIALSQSHACLIQNEASRTPSTITIGTNAIEHNGPTVKKQPRMRQRAGVEDSIQSASTGSQQTKIRFVGQISRHSADWKDFKQ